MMNADLGAVSLIYDDLGTGPGHQDPPSLALTSVLIALPIIASLSLSGLLAPRYKNGDI